MKTFSLVALLVLGLVFHPFGTVAEASDMQGMKHEGMHMKGDMVLIGDQVVDGVKAMAHIMVYDDAAKASMAKMGIDATHHLMMLFVDEQSGRPRQRRHRGERRQRLGTLLTRPVDRRRPRRVTVPEPQVS